jgi:hypothetical protein
MDVPADQIGSDRESGSVRCCIRRLDRRRSTTRTRRGSGHDHVRDQLLWTTDTHYPNTRATCASPTRCTSHRFVDSCDLDDVPSSPRGPFHLLPRHEAGPQISVEAGGQSHGRRWTDVTTVARDDGVGTLRSGGFPSPCTPHDPGFGAATVDGVEPCRLLGRVSGAGRAVSSAQRRAHRRRQRSARPHEDRQRRRRDLRPPRRPTRSR